MAHNGADSHQVRKYISAVGGFIMMGVAGTLYLSSAYAPLLQTLMNYQQWQVSFIQSIGICGQYLGVTGGMFFDYFGSRATAVVAGMAAALGYVMIWASMTQTVPSSFLTLAFYLFLVGQGSHATYIAALGTNTKLFPPHNRGKLMGILLVPFGLSSGIFTMILTFGFGRERVISFLLFLGICIAVVDASGSLMLLEPPHLASTTSASASPVDITGFQLLRQPLFWIMWCIMFIGAGVGLMFISSMGGMIESLSGEDGHQHLTIVLLSVCNAVSRYAMGYLADKFQSKVPPATWVVACMAIMGVTHLLLAFSDVTVFKIIAPFVGIAYGGFFSLYPLITSLFFGMPHFGQNWGWMVTASGSGSFTFQMLGSYFYAKEINSPTTRKCYGRTCWQNTLLCTSLLSSVACVLAAIVVKISMQRMRSQEESNSSAIDSRPPLVADEDVKQNLLDE